MGEPFGTPPPPGLATDVSEISASLHDASEPSMWVSGTLRDSALYRDFISAIETLRQTIWTAFEALIAVLEVIIALFEAVKAILQLLDALITAAIKILIETLQALKDLLIQFLSDMLGMGFYFFPHFQHYDWNRVISDCLLNPYGVSYGHEGVMPVSKLQTIAPSMHAFPDPTKPGQFSYRMITKPGKRGTGIDQFLKDLEKSFGNTNDRLRPIFSSAQGISGTVVIMGFNDVFVFARIVIFLMDILNPKGNYGVQMANYIKEHTMKALGQANANGTGAPEALENAQKFLDDCGSDDIVNSLIDGVIVGERAPDAVTDTPAIQLNDVSDSDGDTVTGNLAVVGYIGDNNIYTALEYGSNNTSFGTLNPGSASAYLGSYRSNQLAYSASQYVKNGTCRLFVQRLLGEKVAYQSPVKLSTSAHGVMPELNGISRGVLLQESSSEKRSQFVSPLEYSSCENPALFPKTLAVGTSGADKVFGQSNIEGGTVAEGSWYINVKTRVVRYFNGTSWYTAAKPNVLMFTSWDAATDGFVAGPILLFVIRFKLVNETIKTLDTSVDPPIDGYATYAYNDDFSTGGQCEVTLSWTRHAKAAALLGVPQSNFNVAAGLPKRAGGGGGILDMSLFSWDGIMTESKITSNGKALPTDIVTSFRAPQSAAEGSWYLFRNHKRMARMTDDVFTGMDISGGLDRISYENGKTVVSLTGELLDEGVTAIEVIAENTDEVLPVGPGGGQELYAISATTYSRPITYQVVRQQPTPTGGVLILSAKIMTPRTVDATFMNELQALGGSFVKGWTDLTSADAWKDFFNEPNNQFLAKYYFRGFKPANAGVLAQNTSAPEKSFVYEKDAKTVFKAKDPLILPTGVHNFRVYSFSDAVYSSIPEPFPKDASGILRYLQNRNKPEDLKGLSDAIDWTVEVDDQLDTRDIPGKHGWQNVSLKRWFDVVEPLDQFLQSLIDSIPIPPSVFQWLIDWIDRIVRRIQYWEQILKDIQEWIDQFLRIFDIGDTGFYFLGINGAAGSQGFIDRVKKVDVPDELAGLPYATGFCMLLPDLVGGAQFMEMLFNWLPQQRLPDEEPPGGYPNPADIIADANKELSDKVQAAIEEASTIVQSTKENFMDDTKAIGTGIKNMSQRNFHKIYPEKKE